MRSLLLFLFSVSLSVCADAVTEPLSGDTARLPMAGRLAWEKTGILGGLSFGNVNGWVGDSPVLKLSLTTGYYYFPNWMGGGGVEVIGSALTDSSSLSLIRYVAFIKHTWVWPEKGLIYTGVLGRIESANLQVISANAQSNASQEINFQNMVRSPVAAIEMGATWKMTNYLSFVFGTDQGLGWTADYRAEMESGLALDLKSIFKGLFKPAGLCYLTAEAFYTVPSPSHYPQFQGGMTLGF